MEMYRFLGVLGDIQDLASELVPMRRYKVDGRQVDKEWDFVETWPSTPDFPYVRLNLFRRGRKCSWPL
jgi:hypothetical protein